MPDLYREPVDSSAEAPDAPVAPLNSVGTELSSVESEIAELEKQLVQKRALLGTEKDLFAEAVAKVERPLEQIISAEKLTPSSAPPSQTPSSAPAVAPVTTPAPAKPEAKEFKGLEKNQQLKNLVDLAFQKGITYAADVARELDSAYLLDEFHDTLVDKLHKELVEKGKLEEI
ncbi:MAG: hypothetical protein ABIG65_00340 [Patescibacteria group bacterium]